MKKYHIADLLTLSRVFFAAAIVLFAFRGAPQGLVLALFCVGEFTDALDGPLSRLYPYPEVPKKYRFWREGKFPKIFDTGTDILLGLSFGLYTFLQVDRTFAVFVALPIISVALFTTPIIQLFPQEQYRGVIDRIIKYRREFYFCSLFVLIIGNTFALRILPFGRLILIWLEVLAMAIIAFAKSDRLNER